MKTVYFDTYVYNRLADEKKLKKDILKLAYNKKIEVFFSDCLFNELACSFLQNPTKGRKIFEIVSKLISGKILKQRESLINEEIKAFLNDDATPKVIYPLKNSSEIIKVINRISRENPTNNQPLLDTIESKRKNHKAMKEIVSVDKENINFERFPSFEIYYSNHDVRANEDEYIKQLLSGKILQKLDGKTLQKIKENRHNLPHFNAYLRMIAAYRFALFKMKTQSNIGTVKKPNRGDDYDMRHFTSVATLDILVCDRDFLQIMEWTYPHKCCVILDNFLNLFLN